MMAPARIVTFNGRLEDELRVSRVSPFAFLTPVFWLLLVFAALYCATA